MSVETVDFSSLDREIDELLNTDEDGRTMQALPLPLDSCLQQAANIPLPAPSRDERLYFQAYNWNADEVMIFDEYIIYHQKMVAIINHVKTAGPVKKLPTPPKRKLKDMFNEKLGKKKKRDTVMTPQGFHTYLQQHLADMRFEISRKKFNFENPKNIDEAVEKLKDAYRHLNRQNAQSMMMNILFGQF